MPASRFWMQMAVAMVLVGCGGGGGSEGSSGGGGGEPALGDEAGVVTILPRDVAVHDREIRLRSTAKMFWNFRVADEDPEDKPIFVLFNGFAAEVVRSFGTGPMTVREGGEVVANPSSLTRIANLLYVDPRQSGYSYDLPGKGGRTAADCSADVFNEYVDAADVLLAVMQFSQDHPRLRGPVFWVGESYAGVRIQWIATYLREAWSAVPYRDETLRTALEGATTSRSWLAGQILLEPWLLGKEHADAIGEACLDGALVAAVAASVGGTCTAGDACACAGDFGRSPYDFAFSVAHQDARVGEADRAHVDPAKAEKLLGLSLSSVAELAAKERSRGFKCSAADDTTPDESALEKLLGPLPAGQSYYLSYSPLQPGKETTAGDPDWNAASFEGAAFLGNLGAVPTLITDGPRDLVVPERALVPGLRALLGAAKVEESSSAIEIHAGKTRLQIDVRRYPEAGHMITMVAPDDFASDVTGWLAKIAP